MVFPAMCADMQTTKQLEKSILELDFIFNSGKQGGI